MVATRYLVAFAPLPAFRNLSPEEHQDLVAEMIVEIQREGEEARDGNPVARVDKILSQDPFEPPTRHTKRSPRPLVHVERPEVKHERSQRARDAKSLLRNN